MKFARRQRVAADINLTPLIDVVFLLLIFFMVTTTFTRQTQLSIDLPVSGLQTPPETASQIEIAITREGQYAVNGTKLVNERALVNGTNLVNQETLRSAIAALSNGDNRMTITADAATPHQAVVTAMDVAGQLGFTSLSLTTVANDYLDEQP